MMGNLGQKTHHKNHNCDFDDVFYDKVHRKEAAKPSLINSTLRLDNSQEIFFILCKKFSCTLL